VKVACISKPHFHGQQSIDSARTLEIQQALIREHYLQGDATGEWDQATRDALTRLQEENHWQTKILPDARALIKLGLGPSQQNLLNPESAAIAMPFGLNRSAQGGANR
jgi:putative peptidoglycan binding protein